MAQQPLSPTARVILGMIAKGVRTGYDIKAFVDKTTRHFWGISYGQIYPELRRLESRGLVRSRSEPSGERQRRVVELTPAGEEALLTWLRSPEEPSYELRDEGMLKLFFSDFAGPEHKREQVRAIRLRNQRTLAQLRALEQEIGPLGDSGPHLTLRLGITFHQTVADWCEQVERELEPETEPEVVP